MLFHLWKHSTNVFQYLCHKYTKTYKFRKIYIHNIFNIYLQIPRLRTDIPHLCGQNQNKSNKYP